MEYAINRNCSRLLLDLISSMNLYIIARPPVVLKLFMWEEGINTKPQIYYNNNNAGTPQASKRKKKGNSDREMENTHTK